MKVNNIRFFVAAIATFSAYAVYLSRVNLSIAIIAMVEDPSNFTKVANETKTTTTPVVKLDQLQDYTFSLNDTARATGEVAQRFLSSNLTNGHEESLATIFPLKNKNSLKTPLISKEKFDWSIAVQGDILGAFFYGYILFQIPGARMAESAGARWIIMAATCGSGLVSLIFPLSTQLNSIYLLMALRFVMGLCQSAFFPAAYVLYCRWFPEAERSVLLPVMFIGSYVGSISTYIMSSYLIGSDYGWPSVFHVSGLICLLVSFAWCIFGSSGPEDNWLITDEESDFILRQVNSEMSESSSLDDLTGRHLSLNSTPPRLKGLENGNDSGSCCNSRKTSLKPTINEEPSWPKLLKSIPIWTLILSMYGNEWSNVVLCYEIPTYLNFALGYPIERNGVINSFFQLSYVVASPLMSSLGAYMLKRRTFGMRKIHVRKLFQSLATFGQLICFISVPICGANEGLIVLFMFASVVFRACSNAGDIMVAGDLSPEYAGTIFACANSVGNTAGFFVPKLAGFFITNAKIRDQWTPFWLTTGCIMGCSGLIFLILGQTNRQDFSKDPESEASLKTIESRLARSSMEVKSNV